MNLSKGFVQIYLLYQLDLGGKSISIYIYIYYAYYTYLYTYTWPKGLLNRTADPTADLASGRGAQRVNDAGREVLEEEVGAEVLAGSLRSKDSVFVEAWSKTGQNGYALLEAGIEAG